MKIDQKDLHKPGTDNLPPGVYKEVGPRGGKITGSKEVPYRRRAQTSAYKQSRQQMDQKRLIIRLYLMP